MHTRHVCSQACTSSALNEYSHNKRNEYGDVKYLPGWAGDLCDVPKCRKGYDPMQGYCCQPGECRCKLGFYGENCNRCIPLPGCQHGDCNVRFECACEKGRDGLFFSDPICHCDCHIQRDYCEAPGECRCCIGWSGPTYHDCQVLRGCAHGTCSKFPKCKCLSNSTGILCSTPICAKTCHREKGYCRRTSECRCRVGWSGDDCTKCFLHRVCKNRSCQRPWECNCNKGNVGLFCDEELNYCNKNPEVFQNGGNYRSHVEADGFLKCKCPSCYCGKIRAILPAEFVNSTDLANSTTAESEVSSTREPIIPYKVVLSSTITEKENIEDNEA